jgi:hypothetical protein
MKKKLVLLSGVATLALFLAVTGCRKSDNLYFGTVSFWNIDIPDEDIVVTVDGRYTETITAAINPAYCNDYNTANFYLPEGYHSYYAESVGRRHVIWSNDFLVSGDCKLLELYR